MKKQEKFIPTKNMWYVYFNFYGNNSDELKEFKEEMEKLYDFILGFKERIGIFGTRQVLVYVSSEEETNRIKNEKTLNLYQKYVGKNGFQM